MHCSSGANKAIHPVQSVRQERPVSWTKETNYALRVRKGKRSKQQISCMSYYRQRGRMLDYLRFIYNPRPETHTHTKKKP